MKTTRRARLLAAPLAAALLTGGALVLSAAPAGAVECTPATTADDGSATSLRGILEDLSTNGCGPVVLAPGALYQLTDDAAGDIEIDAPVTIEGNGATIEQTDGDDNILETSDDLTVRDLTLTGGREVGGDGGAVESDGSSLVIERSYFFDNGTFGGSGDGGAINTEDSEGTVLVVDSTFSGNCSEDDGGAMDVNGSLTIVNSTITGNVADDQGAVDSDGELVTLVYTDLVANVHEDGVDCDTVLSSPVDETGVDEEPEAGTTDDDVETEDTDEPANLEIGSEGGTLRSFGSIVALPIDPDQPPFNCDVGATSSSGYNFSDDATCGFTEATDTEDGPDPHLGALADNGGPTPTMLPAVTSPLVNAIPIDACGDGDGLAGFAVTTDQRGITRPQETGCEIGSVELEAVVPPPPIVLEPTFTG
jgi:hypothetical protein